MRPNPAEAQALVKLLTSIYEEIHAIETDLGIRVSDGDMRPRIEHFHDAVRAYTSGENASPRLSVERLAYDLSWLRYIQSNPLAISRGTRQQSPQTSVVPHGQSASTRSQPDRETRLQLAERYQQYAVIFAALLAEKADRDYHSRIEEHNNAVEDLAQVEQMLKMVAEGQAKPQEVEHVIEAISDNELRQKIALMMHDKAQRKRLQSDQFTKQLKEKMAAHDKEIDTIEQAHFSFLSSQLLVYQESKDMVKKLAVQGLNLAGKFLQNAVAEVSRGARGR